MPGLWEWIVIALLLIGPAFVGAQAGHRGRSAILWMAVSLAAGLILPLRILVWLPHRLGKPRV